VFSSFAVLYLFLYQFRREVLQVARKIFFILMMVMIMLIVVKIISKSGSQRLILLVPFAIIPVVMRTFFDARLAIFILLTTLMLASLMVEEPFEMLITNFLSGMSAIFTLSFQYRRAKLLFTSLAVMVSYTIVHGGFVMITGANIIEDIPLIAANSAFVLLSYPVILIFEQRFLFLSDNTLLELSDTRNPLLVKLASEAPGSFQHSLQVANIAEEAARAIRANVLLVRAGSLYHDIGKIANSEYYIENQLDSYSPHSKLTPLESSKLIISHVRKGVVLAKNYKLPVQIIDFIKTHHGTSVAYFFYKQYADQNPSFQAESKNFMYPGPKPVSRETAIVMMADAVEAASRSLGNYNEDSISEMVERIIYIQEQDGQYSDAPLTYRDISEIKSAFVKRLVNIYHPRIIYPERN
jgi:putative nucleotidyltransferase with HDIG domain